MCIRDRTSLRSSKEALSKAQNAEIAVAKSEKDIEIYKNKIKAARARVEEELKATPNSIVVADKMERLKHAEAKIQEMEAELKKQKAKISEGMNAID